ncbi:MAG: transcription-repair coupling factor, partial [Clostridiales bacterium]|nr:transcription-repair coupling factor [Clostridiales bacterium]
MYTALETLKVYQDLLRELEKAPAPLSVSGGMESQKHQLAAALAEHAAGHAANQPADGTGWALYVCADEKEAAGAAADLSCFMKGVWQYPARDLLFYHSDIHGSYILNRRMEALRHLLEDPRGILVTTVDALMDQIQPRESLQNDLLKLAEGMIITTRSLSRILTGLGYEHAAAVEGMGQYSIRGGIVDIYPMTAEEPCRIEFFDDEIDTIRSFDPATQRSVERLKEVEIFPAGDSISKGQKVSLLEYFDEKALIFADDPVRLKARAEMVETEFAESMERRREKGIIPDVGAGVRPYDKSGQGSREDGEEGELPEIFSASRIFESLRSRRTLLLAGLDESLAGFGAKLDFHFSTAAVGNYRDSFEMLISDIRNYQKQGYRITVLTPS